MTTTPASKVARIHHGASTRQISQQDREDLARMRVVAIVVLAAFALAFLSIVGAALYSIASAS